MIQSNEANLYIIDNTIVKIYHPHVSAAKKRAEFDFLSTYQDTGYVPVLYSTLDNLIHHNSIVMQYMHDYITLNRVPKLLASLPLPLQNTIKMWIADALIVARLAIGQNTYYTDLHLKNVLINMDTLHVIFIDPGCAQPYQNAWQEWVMDVARQLHMTKVMKQQIKDYIKSSASTTFM